MTRLFVVAVLAACSSGTSSRPLKNTAPPPASLADALESARARDGDLLLASGDDGITAYTPDLAVVAKVTKTPGRYVHADPKHRALYYFVERRLVRLDLASGQERTVATLPELHHVCFGSESNAVNPLDFIQRDEDVVFDLDHGFACLNVQDRNANMMSVAIAYRVALDSGAVASKTTFTLDTCREPGELENTDGPCQAGDLMAGPDWVSPSKRWEIVRDAELGEQGDYIYSATLLADKQTKKTYAVRAEGTVELDYAMAKANHKVPEGTCLLPYETLVRWFPHADVAVIVGCGETGAMFIRPPSSVHTLPGRDFAFY